MVLSNCQNNCFSSFLHWVIATYLNMVILKIEWLKTQIPSLLISLSTFYSAFLLSKCEGYPNLKRQNMHPFINGWLGSLGKPRVITELKYGKLAENVAFSLEILPI